LRRSPLAWIEGTSANRVSPQDAYFVVVFPLVVASQPMGVLCVYSRDLWEGDALTLLAIESLANHAAAGYFRNNRDRMHYRHMRDEG